MYMMFFGVIALALLVYFVYMMGRKQSESRDTDTENPTDILKRRFAEGEIGEREYDDALLKLKE